MTFSNLLLSQNKHFWLAGFCFLLVYKPLYINIKHLMKYEFTIARYYDVSIFINLISVLSAYSASAIVDKIGSCINLLDSKDLISYRH